MIRNLYPKGTSYGAHNEADGDFFYDAIKSGKKYMYRMWRKVHLYSFGYFKWLSLVISLLMVVISITGILYNHHHDFKFLTSWRVPVEIVPAHFQERLEKTRALQGIPDMGGGEVQSVPLIWVVIDLHTGAFFGPWGRLFYDAIGLIFILLAGSGMYLYWKRKR